jgi:hypothetical protein
MARVYVEGDHEALDRITAALRSAGLSGVDVELAARPPDVRRLPAAPGNWAAYADVGPELSYADWRDEILSLLPPDERGPFRPAPTLAEPAPAALRRAG